MEYGIVYLLTNPVMPGLVKIGMTTQEDIDKRMNKALRAAGILPTARSAYHRASDNDVGREGLVRHLIFNPGISGFTSTSSSSFTIERVPCLYFRKCGVCRWLS